VTVRSLRRTASPLAFLCALGAGTAAVAQDAAKDDTQEIVVTAQRTNQTQVIRGGQVGILGDKPASDVPFSIKSYNSALILNQQPQTLGQVLENDPTIRTTYGFGNAAEQFVIRGFTLYGDDIGLDGLYGVTPRQLIAPELYDQVQVLNGASAFLNGAAPGGSGIGGSVNLVPKRAGDKDLYRITANYTGSSHFGGAFDVSHRFDDGTIGLRINGAFRSGDVATDDEFRQTAVVGGALDYRGSDVRLSLDLDYQRVKVRNLRPKVTIATATIPAVPRASHNYGQSFTYSNLRDLFGIVRGEWDLTSNVTAYGSFGARDGSEKGIYDGITVTNALTGDATGNALYVPRTDNNEAAQVGLRAKFKTGGISHELNVGGSAVWQVNRNAYDFRYGPGFAGYATNLYNTPSVALPSSSLVGGNLNDPFPVSRTDLRSVFASDTIGLLNDSILITGGARLQGIEARGYSYFDGSQTSRYKKDAVTPVVGIVYKPTGNISLFANRIQGLVQGPTAPVDATIDNPGEIFAPYKSTQYEVGGKLAIGRFNTSLAVYQTKQPSAYAVPIAAGSSLQRYGLFGEQRNRGVEFSVDGELARGLRIIAGGSINDAKLRNTAGGANDGNRAQGVPTYLANANVEWDLPFLPRATLTGRVVQTGKQEVNAANTLEIPAWTRFDLGARYVVLVQDKPVTLRVNVDNVANNRYWASAYDSFSAALLQGAPRTFKASVSIDF
jgi:iron complex outermembrane receptor protein